jgi:hypothetical protein
MANYSPKGIERMRALGRVGGVKSGEARRNNAGLLCILRAISNGPISAEEAWISTPAEIISRAEQERKPNCAGGSHDLDWRCPHCRHFNSIKRRACAKCKAVSPKNGRLTRAELRVRAEEHRTQAILAMHGL